MKNNRRKVKLKLVQLISKKAWRFEMLTGNKLQAQEDIDIRSPTLPNEGDLVLHFLKLPFPSYPNFTPVHVATSKTEVAALPIYT